MKRRGPRHGVRAGWAWQRNKADIPSLTPAERIEACCHAWETSRNFAALAEALVLCSAPPGAPPSRLALPWWAVRAVNHVLANVMAASAGKQTDLLRVGRRHLSDVRALVRHHAVEKGRALLLPHAPSKDDRGRARPNESAHQFASEYLRSTWAEGQPDTMRKAYQLIERRRKSTTMRASAYWTIGLDSATELGRPAGLLGVMAPSPRRAEQVRKAFQDRQRERRSSPPEGKVGRFRRKN